MSRWVGFLPLKILVPSVSLILDSVSLILDDPDVSRGRSWRYVPFGCLGQLFELTFLPTSPEGAAP